MKPNRDSFNFYFIIIILDDRNLILNNKIHSNHKAYYGDEENKLKIKIDFVRK